MAGCVGLLISHAAWPDTKMIRDGIRKQDTQDILCCHRAYATEKAA